MNLYAQSIGVAWLQLGNLKKVKPLVVARKHHLLNTGLLIHELARSLLAQTEPTPASWRSIAAKVPEWVVSAAVQVTGACDLQVAHAGSRVGGNTQPHSSSTVKCEVIENLWR